MATNRRRVARNPDPAGEEALPLGAVPQSPDRLAGAGNVLRSPPPGYIEAANPPQPPPFVAANQQPNQLK